MKRGDYRGRMVVPCGEMLFLPAIEERLDWMDHVEGELARYQNELVEVERRHEREMVRLHEEFEA